MDQFNEIQQQILIYSLYFPEVYFVASLFSKVERLWIRKLIEDSDDDPNHTDGFFVATIWLAILCFRESISLSMDQTTTGNDNIKLIWTYLFVGCALLGVRLSRSGVDKFVTNVMDKLKTKKDE